MSSCIISLDPSSVCQYFAFISHELVLKNKNTTVLPGPPYQDATGCFVIHANNLVVWCWTSLMVWNARAYNVIFFSYYFFGLKQLHFISYFGFDVNTRGSLVSVTVSLVRRFFVD